MKKIGLLLICLCVPFVAGAQETDDFDSFMQQQQKEFNQFMDDANKEFINFMRNPWAELEGEKPVEKPVKPEPVKPIVYDEKTAPKDEKPVCLTIEEILDQSTAEGKQKPVTKVKDTDDITFDKPEVIVKKKKEPTVIVVEEKVADKQPATEKKNPVVVVEEEPVADTQPEVPVAEDKPETKPEVKKPVVVVEENPVVTKEPTVVEKPQPETKPVTKPTTKPATQSSKPLFAGGTGRTKFVYAGSTYYFSNGLNRKCKLSGTNENAVADAYETLCKADYKPLIEDFNTLTKGGELNDWMVFMLVKQVAEAYCSTTNESVVMRQFLLNQLGYKARMARKASDNSLVLYATADSQLYGCPYIKQNNDTYYDIDSKQPYSFYMCQQDAPNAKNQLGMAVKTNIAVGGETVSSTHQAKNSDAKVTVDVPKSLMEVYKSYPQCEYKVFATSKVNAGVEDEILSALSPLVQGKSEQDAANLLLNFVQTGFEYQTDDEQFGYEKPFFVEELFYYPYCDCEDRSVLYAYLVKNLLGLDVVYLDYPNHIATAVRFTQDVSGDYLMVGSQKYTVCDPTYIGASIGMTMPQFKTVAAKVLKY
ncbi:MAG: hypothetical protein Q4D56_08700 [Bacteroides sp.]|nr:hypothetical protein [Bacteroides sp.]